MLRNIKAICCTELSTTDGRCLFMSCWKGSHRCRHSQVCLCHSWLKKTTTAAWTFSQRCSFCNHEATPLLGGHLWNANVPRHRVFSQTLQLLVFYSRWQTDKEMCVCGGVGGVEEVRQRDARREGEAKAEIQCGLGKVAERIKRVQNHNIADDRKGTKRIGRGRGECCSFLVSSHVLMLFFFFNSPTPPNPPNPAV